MWIFELKGITNPNCLRMKELLKSAFDLMHLIISIFQRRKAGEIVVRTSEIYDIMRDLVHVHHEYNIERFMILRAHNGGQDMKEFTPHYVSLVHEDFRHPIKSCKADYQKLDLDGEYIKLLKNLYLKGAEGVSIRTSELEKGSLLRNIYEAEGVLSAKVFFVHHTRKEFILLSVASSRDTLEGYNEPKAKNAIFMAVNKIKRLMKY